MLNQKMELLECLEDKLFLENEVLLGKEAKQLAPLVVVLVGCGVLLHLLGLLNKATDKNFFHATILTLIPVLFAVGVGPLLVSQEKEQRTLRWMASLPVRPRAIKKVILGGWKFRQPQRVLLPRLYWWLNAT